ncbi:MAG: hypothetical protein ACJ76K_02760 [Solirubrobacteraceae bacterium]
MRKLLALPLAAVAVLLVSPPARAGTYPMAQCQSTPARALSDGWGVFGGAGIYNTCGGDNGFGLWINELEYNTSAGMGIAVPASRPHVTIQRIDTGMNVAQEFDQVSFVRWFAGNQIIFDRELTGWAESLISRTPHDASRDFTIDVYCTTANGPANCRFSDLHRVVVLSWLTFTLAEEADPTARATGGSLLAPGERRGTQTLAFTADDEDSGLTAVTVKLGGAAVGSYDFSASCTYTDWNACPTSQSRTLDVDTTRVRDGSYPLRLDVVDAAGNAVTVDTGRTVTIANAGTASSAAVGEGANAADRGRHNGSGEAAAAILTAELVNRRQAMVLPYRRGAVTVSGRLTQRDGTPIAGARLDVASQTVLPGLPGPDAGQVVTDDDGHWSMTTAQGPSRQVSVGWRAFDRDRSYAETTNLSLLVRAGASMAVRPRRVANGRRVLLSGKLLGRPFPAGGVLVTLQGKPRRGGKWRTFGVTRTRPDGRFRYRYRFTRIAGGSRTFLFRTRINRQEGYPYESGVDGKARSAVSGRR